MKYQFEKSVAEQVGVEAAILLSNIEFWVEKNAANEKHFYDGNYWTYNTMKAFAKLFPFWTEKQVRRILQTLLDNNLVKKGNYNQRSYDQTLWYTSTRNDFLIAKNNICPNGRMDLPKRADRIAQMGEPIPDNKPDSKTTVNVNVSHKKEKKKFVSVKKTKLGELPDLPIGAEETESIAQKLAHYFDDPHSEDFYHLVAAKVPYQDIARIIADIKKKGAENPPALFAYRTKLYAEQHLGDSPPEFKLETQALAARMALHRV